VPGPGGKAGARRPITHKRHEKGQQVTSTLSPGTTLAAVEAMRSQDTFTRDQVAYLVHLAYETGRLHGYAGEMADTVECWQEHVQPRVTRAQRQAARAAAMRNPPAGTYLGGPVDWETGTPLREGA
jgi:hypothetical protein